MNEENNKGKQTFSLLVRSREGIIYQGQVTSLTSVNEKGKFDILAQHANFISLISSILVIGEVGGGKKEIRIDNGLLRSKGNKVEVYIGIEKAIPEKTSEIV